MKLCHLLRVCLLLTLATLPLAAQATREATIKQACSITLGSKQIPLTAGSTVTVLSQDSSKATISFVGPDGSSVIAQIAPGLLKDSAVTAPSIGVTAVVPAAPPPLPMASMTPAKLLCDYRVNPLGIDSTNPRLGWILMPGDPSARGLNQTAYQILVATFPELLARDQGDLWDSHKVPSDQMNQLPYGGKALESNQACWWKVRVWDQAGIASPWSAPAQWTMGVLNDADWQSAKWIAAPDANEPNDRKGAKSKYETVLLRREFTVKPGLKRAIVHVCGLGQYEMSLNGAKVSQDLLSPGWTLYTKTCLYDSYDVTSALVQGQNAVGLFLGSATPRFKVRSAPCRLSPSFNSTMGMARLKTWSQTNIGRRARGRSPFLPSMVAKIMMHDFFRRDGVNLASTNLPGSRRR
jgi:hypothetical protein